MTRLRLKLRRGMARDGELEDFKREIDLRQYAAEQGYIHTRRSRWTGRIMR